MKLALGKFVKPKTLHQKCPICGNMINDIEFASHMQHKHSAT